MTQTTTKTRKQTEITSPVVYRCTDKVTGEIFYAVPSDSGNGLYKVTFNEVTRRYEDTCPARGDCKHCRAVRSVVLAKAEIAKQGNTSPAPMAYSDGLKTSFSSVEEEFQYKLGAYGKKVAYGWLYEQKAHTTVEVVPTGQAEEVAAVAEVQAEAKMDAFKRGMDEQYASDPRRGLSLGEIETAQSEMRHFYDEY